MSALIFPCRGQLCSGRVASPLPPQSPSFEILWDVVFHSCRGKTLIIVEAVGIDQGLVPGSGRGAKSAAVGHIPLNVGNTRGMEEKALPSPLP
jgi:hypothetical protein